MFEASLSEKLKRIFDLKKATFNLPSESQEQETLFIEVSSAKNKIKDGRATAVVRGKIRVFCNQDKVPYGYFSKKIDSAAKVDIQDLFFYDIEENAGTFLNISERSMSFVYLFETQYDPALGEINELETSFGS